MSARFHASLAQMRQMIDTIQAGRRALMERLAQDLAKERGYSADAMLAVEIRRQLLGDAQRVYESWSTRVSARLTYAKVPIERQARVELLEALARLDSIMHELLGFGECDEARADRSRPGIVLH